MTLEEKREYNRIKAQESRGKRKKEKSQLLAGVVEKQKKGELKLNDMTPLELIQFIEHLQIDKLYGIKLLDENLKTNSGDSNAKSDSATRELESLYDVLRLLGFYETVITKMAEIEAGAISKVA